MKLAELFPVLSENQDLNALVFAGMYGTDFKDKVPGLQKRSEEILDPVLMLWENRLGDAMKAQMALGHQPEQIMQWVPWVTEDEVKALRDAIDLFIEEDTPYALVMRVYEFRSFIEYFRNRSIELLRVMWMQELQKREQSLIISPNGPGHKPGTIITS